MTNVSAFFSEFLATAVLMICVLAIGDRRNAMPPSGLAPLALFILILGIGACLGMETGSFILSLLRLETDNALSVCNQPCTRPRSPTAYINGWLWQSSFHLPGPLLAVVSNFGTDPGCSGRSGCL